MIALVAIVFAFCGNRLYFLWQSPLLFVASIKPRYCRYQSQILKLFCPDSKTIKAR